MFCKECGKEIFNDSKFCSYCGAKQSVKQVTENHSELSPKPDPTTQNVNISLSFKKPTFKKEDVEVKVEKYDSTYKSDSDITRWGLIFVILNVALYFIAKYQEGDAFVILIVISIVTGLISWIVAIRWVVKVAERQNRNSTFWGVFTALIPYLAMIIIGFLKRINTPSNSPINKTNWAVISAVFIIPIIIAFIIIITNH